MADPAKLVKLSSCIRRFTFSQLTADLFCRKLMHVMHGGSMPQRVLSGKDSVACCRQVQSFH